MRGAMLFGFHKRRSFGFAESQNVVAVKDRLPNNHDIALADALPAITAFRKAYGRDATPDFIAELYVAREFDLKLPTRRNEPGGAPR